MISGEVVRFSFPLRILLVELIRLHVVNLVGKMLLQLKLEHIVRQFITHKVRENIAGRIAQIVEQEVPFDKTNRIIQCHDRIIITTPESIVQDFASVTNVLQRAQYSPVWREIIRLLVAEVVNMGELLVVVLHIAHAIFRNIVIVGALAPILYIVNAVRVQIDLARRHEECAGRAEDFELAVNNGVCRLLLSLGILFRVVILDFVQTDGVDGPDAEDGFALPLNTDNNSAQLQ